MSSLLCVFMNGESTFRYAYYLVECEYWYFPSSFTNKTEFLNMTEIFLKLACNAYKSNYK